MEQVDLPFEINRLERLSVLRTGNQGAQLTSGLQHDAPILHPRKPGQMDLPSTWFGVPLGWMVDGLARLTRGEGPREGGVGEPAKRY